MRQEKTGLTYDTPLRVSTDTLARTSLRFAPAGICQVQETASGQSVEDE